MVEMLLQMCPLHCFHSVMQCMAIICILIINFFLYVLFNKKIALIFPFLRINPEIFQKSSWCIGESIFPHPYNPASALARWHHHPPSHHTSRQPTSLYTGTSVLSSLRLLTLTICHIWRPPVAQPNVWTHRAAAHMNNMGHHSSVSICSTHSLSL